MWEGLAGSYGLVAAPEGTDGVGSTTEGGCGVDGTASAIAV